MNAFIHFMEKRFIPVANKISSNRYLKSVSTGSMSLLGVIMLGAIFTVISSLSWEPYQNFLSVTNIGTVMNYIPAYTIDLLGLYMAFSIAYCGAGILGSKNKLWGRGSSHWYVSCY